VDPTSMRYDVQIDLTTRQEAALALSWRDPEVLLILGAIVLVVASAFAA
jgi:hypothetical protein